MSNGSKPTAGSIVWTDLTAPGATQLRDFYSAVTGWRAEAVSMGDYADFTMLPPGGSGPVAGICHARGSNASVPAQWLIYIAVSDLEAAMAACRSRGGAVIDGPRPIGGRPFCVIRDPAGAAAALIES
jgi:predicted enzyme related to lactoylglutathione lyase